MCTGIKTKTQNKLNPKQYFVHLPISFSTLNLTPMKLKTTYNYNTTTENLWPLLFGSKMDKDKPCRFLFGLPKPMECKLEGETGGIGKSRQCISDKGTIQQRIIEWEPQKVLSFEMAETDIYFGPCVESIIESFHLQEMGTNKSSITRTTEFKLKSNRFFLTIPIYIGLKNIHWYVFKNWNRIVTESK